MKAYIRRILKSSAVDGPGNRMVIFFQGCNLNCAYCHNPETIDIDKDGSLTDASVMTLEDIWRDVEKGLGFISGITVSGGECTVQYPFLLALAQFMKEREVSVFVDTNGTLPLEKMKELIPYVDGFMLDVKALDSDVHQRIMGGVNTRVLENLELLAETHKLYEVRTVVIPEIIDNEATVDYVSEVLYKYDPSIRYKLIQFRKHGVRESLTKDFKSPTLSYMDDLKKRALDKGLTQVIIT